MSDLSKLRDKIAVIGVGHTKYANFPEIGDYGLAAHAFRNAVGPRGFRTCHRRSDIAKIHRDLKETS